MSGLRFVRHAAKHGKPVVIINRGQTRGDDLATVKLDAGVSESLTWLAQRTAAAVSWRVAAAGPRLPIGVLPRCIRYSHCSLVEALRRGNHGLGL